MYRLRYGMILMLLMLAACGTATETTSGNGASSAGTEATTSTTNGSTAETTTSSGGQAAAKQYDAAPPMTIDPNKTYTAVIETTKGTLRAELFAEEAPVTVNNFVFLARDGFYNNVAFHRIIKGFMAQTGDPRGDGTGGPGYQFEDEPVTRPYTRGTLAMANSGADTNGSQFFIMHADYDLQPDYTIFGQVMEGLETLDTIADVPVSANPMTGEQSVPEEEVRITRITIEEQ